MSRLTSYTRRWICDNISRSLSVVDLRSHISIFALSSSVAATALYTCYPRASLNEPVLPEVNVTQDDKELSQVGTRSKNKTYTAYTHDGKHRCMPHSLRLVVVQSCMIVQSMPTDW